MNLRNMMKTVKIGNQTFETGKVYDDPYASAFKTDMVYEIKGSVAFSEGLGYHVQRDIPLAECIYRMGSKAYLEIFNEARKLVQRDLLELNDPYDRWFINTDLGKTAKFEGKSVLLDLPMINEVEYEGEEVELNSPKRGGSKKYYVYVKNPDSGKVNKVSFGAEGGGQNLSVKFKDKEARDAFASRHNCDQKTDKTKPGYWSCNLPKYADQLGLSGGGNFYW